MKDKEQEKPKKKPDADDQVEEKPFDEIVSALLRVPPKKKGPFKKNSP